MTGVNCLVSMTGMTVMAKVIEMTRVTDNKND